MRRIIHLIIIFLTVFILFKPFLINHLLPIPSDTIVGLYYPFRDLYAATNPNGVPFHNFLITDPVRQQYPWRSLSIQLEKHFQIPLWNPYSFSGMPLLANLQSGSLYPFNLLFFVLPFAAAWSVLIVVQPLLAGIFLYLYLRRMKISQSASLLGGIVFAFCGFSVSWMEWNTVMQTALWLPLILLAKEHLLEKMSVKWSIIFVFAQCAAFFAGHLQTFFYMMCVHEPYIIARIVQETYRKKDISNNFAFARNRYVPFVFLGTIIIVITSIQWFPTLILISESARNIDQNWHIAGWFIPWQNLLQFIIPDFFGNPATNNYWGVWNYQEFIGYIGIVPLIVALFALFFRRDKKTLFFGTLFFLSLLFALPTFFAQIPFVLNIPFLSTAQPTRLLFITDFSLAVLAALGFDYFLKVSYTTEIPLLEERPRGSEGRGGKLAVTQAINIVYIIAFFFLIFICIWGLVLFNSKINLISPENLSVTKHNLVLPTVLFLISVGFFAIFVFLIPIAGRDFTTSLKLRGTGQFGPKRFLKLTPYPLPLTPFLISCFLILASFDLLRFSSKFETFASGEYLFPDTKVTSYLQTHAGNNRIMTTDSRIFAPNFSIMYRLQSVDGYDPLYLGRYGELIAASERGKPDIAPPFGFNRIITPHKYDSQIINLLGVKYILSLSDLQYASLKKVFQDGQTQIYENSSALPRAFFVYDVIGAVSKQEAMSKLFDPSLDLTKQAVIELQPGSELPISSGVGVASIIKYSENDITIKTTSERDSYLVLTDIYYPTWHAKIDGKETKIFLTDYAFRGIIVPKGQHTIEFHDQLF